MNVQDQSPTFTEDGFEMTFGVNYLGHFLLTMLLVDDLKKSAPDSRIVIVASEQHNPESRGPKRHQSAHIDFENMQLLAPGTFNAHLAYKNSKLANVLFGYELARRLHGSGVTCNSLCPGFLPQTGLIRHNQCIRCLLVCCFRGFCRCLPITRTTGKGADGIVYVASNESVQGVGGKYFRDCVSVDSSGESMDREVAAKLWNLSAELVQLDAPEPTK